MYAATLKFIHVKDTLLFQACFPNNQQTNDFVSNRFMPFGFGLGSGSFKVKTKEARSGKSCRCVVGEISHHCGIDNSPK